MDLDIPLHCEVFGYRTLSYIFILLNNSTLLTLQCQFSRNLSVFKDILILKLVCDMKGGIIEKAVLTPRARAMDLLDVAYGRNENYVNKASGRYSRHPHNIYTREV